jgi:hypothetical protein
VNADTVADLYRLSTTIEFEIREVLSVETAPELYSSASKD